MSLLSKLGPLLIAGRSLSPISLTKMQPFSALTDARQNNSNTVTTRTGCVHVLSEAIW